MTTLIAIYTFIVANWSTIIFIFGTVATALPVLRQILGILAEMKREKSIKNNWELLKQAAHSVEEYYNANPALKKSTEEVTQRLLDYIQMRYPKFPRVQLESGVAAVMSAENLGATAKVVKAASIAVEVEKSVAAESAKRKLFAAPEASDQVRY